VLDPWPVCAIVELAYTDGGCPNVPVAEWLLWCVTRPKVPCHEMAPDEMVDARARVARSPPVATGSAVLDRMLVWDARRIDEAIDERGDRSGVSVNTTRISCSVPVMSCSWDTCGTSSGRMRTGGSAGDGTKDDAADADEPGRACGESRPSSRSNRSALLLRDRPPIVKTLRILINVELLDGGRDSRDGARPVSPASVARKLGRGELFSECG
jgi:hypothetical protein